MKIFFEGDLQIFKGESIYNKDSARFNAQKAYIEWVLNNPKLNNENVIYFSLGDFFENSIPHPEEVELGLYYLSSGRWKEKYIISGNHDFNRLKNTWSILPFRKLKNTKIILKPQKLNIEGLTCLILPYFYDHIYEDLLEMKKYYESLKGTYDLIITHIQDETQFFGNERISINLNNLKGTRIQGHLHAVKNNKSGYVNSPIAHTKGEVLDKRYCFLYDISSKTIEKIEIPIFLDYKVVEYPSLIEDAEKGRFTLYTIKNSTDKETTLTYYKSKYPNIYIKEIQKEKLQEVEKTFEASKEKTILDFFNEYAIINKLNSKLKKIIEEKLKGEKK